MKTRPEQDERAKSYQALLARLIFHDMEREAQRKTRTLKNYKGIERKVQNQSLAGEI